MAVKKSVKDKAQAWDDLIALGTLKEETRRGYFVISINKGGNWNITITNTAKSFESSDLNKIILDATKYIKENRKEVVPEIKYTL